MHKLISYPQARASQACILLRPTCSFAVRWKWQRLLAAFKWLSGGAVLGSEVRNVQACQELFRVSSHALINHEDVQSRSCTAALVQAVAILRAQRLTCIRGQCGEEATASTGCSPSTRLVRTRPLLRSRSVRRPYLSRA